MPSANDSAAARVMAFQLSRSLNPMRARNVNASDERVEFRGAVLRVVWGWSLFGPHDWGAVTFRTRAETVEVEYELRLLELPALAAAVSLAMATPSLIFGELITGVISFLVFCCLFGGINYLLTQWRFARFIRRVLRRANRRTMPPS